MSMSLLGAAPRAQTIEELQENMDALRVWAEHRDVKFTSDFDEDEREHMSTLMDNMVNSELINRYDEGPETVYAVAADQHAMASYYRNSIVHHFVPKAIAELALLEAAASPGDPLTTFWNEAVRLRDMFKYEFFYVPTDEFHREIRTELGFFDEDWESKIDGSGHALVLLRKMKPLVAHAALKPYVEAYRIMADVFARLPSNETLDQKAAVAAAFKYGRQAYLQRRISSKASIGQILFKNAFKVMVGYDVVDVGDHGLVDKRKRVSKRFRVLSHRIERIRALAMPSDID